MMINIRINKIVFANRTTNIWIQCHLSYIFIDEIMSEKEKHKQADATSI